MRCLAHPAREWAQQPHTGIVRKHRVKRGRFSLPSDLENVHALPGEIAFTPHGVTHAGSCLHLLFFIYPVLLDSSCNTGFI